MSASLNLMRSMITVLKCGSSAVVWSNESRYADRSMPSGSPRWSHIHLPSAFASFVPSGRTGKYVLNTNGDWPSNSAEPTPLDTPSSNTFCGHSGTLSAMLNTRPRWFFDARAPMSALLPIALLRLGGMPVAADATWFRRMTRYP